VKARRKAAAADGDERAGLALRVFTRSVRKAVGGYCWLLGGVDAVVFAGGIGEHDALTRAEVLGGLGGVGISIDPVLNEVKKSGLREIGTSETGTKVLVVPAQEDMMIARHVDRMERAGS
jgi:acetate kinase